MEKELFQIAKWWESKAIPIDWNLLPDDLITNVSSDYLEDKLSFSKECGISKKTVLYFRKVKKFRKDIHDKYETDKIVFGI